GTLTYKTIKGKKQPYLQWVEDGRSVSRYIRKAERERVLAEIEERKRLWEERRAILAELGRPAASGAGTIRETGAAYTATGEYRTQVITGKPLAQMAEAVSGWQKRDCFPWLWEYLTGAVRDRVLLIYGLRRTGKTTLIRQAVGELLKAGKRNAAYIKLRTTDTMSELNRDLQRLQERGFQYVFLDEVTLMRDFIDAAAVLSDIYAASGMKLVLSGTDSLGFWLAKHDELYDRTISIHTTWIPFREHSRLLGTTDIDDYIRYGGTLRAGDPDYSLYGRAAEEAAFRNEESTRRYIDTAICRNVQHALASCEDGAHFRHLSKLYERNELTGAIQRIIEDSNHRFLLSVLTRPFQSRDLGATAEELRKERDPDRQTGVLDEIDRKEISRQLAELLEIREKEEQTIGLTTVHINELKEYLLALDLIRDCPQETLIPNADPLEHILFTQPGLRFAQVEALLYALIKNQAFAARSERERKLVTEKILSDVYGRLLEEIVVYETVRTLPARTRAFPLDFGDGSDLNLLVYHEEDDTCSLYEVKHSMARVPEQSRILRDPEKCRLIAAKYGRIRERVVLYRGETQDPEPDGVRYQNVTEYLRDLPAFPTWH
nr:AAA family ATPase [Clostridia bacterium]